MSKELLPMCVADGLCSTVCLAQSGHAVDMAGVQMSLQPPLAGCTFCMAVLTACMILHRLVTLWSLPYTCKAMSRALGCSQAASRLAVPNTLPATPHEAGAG